MLIELVEGFFVEPEDVSVVKATDKKKCALFTKGQSAIDGGFTLPYTASEVAEHVNDARRAEETGDDGEEEDEEDEDEE